MRQWITVSVSLLLVGLGSACSSNKADKGEDHKDVVFDDGKDEDSSAPETDENSAPEEDSKEPPRDFVTYEPGLKKGNSCDSLEDISDFLIPFTDEESTVGRESRFIYSTGAVCGGVGALTFGDASPDVVYAFTPKKTGVYNIEVQPETGYDLGIMVTDACPPIGLDGFSKLECLGASDSGKEGIVERLSLELEGEKTYFLLVDGWSNDQLVEGAFDLSIEEGEHCSDGIDNTGNGLVDCEDPACIQKDICDESSYENGCSNGKDDTGNGLVDCQDPSCDKDPACDESTYPNGCQNGVDDDGNGLTDCDDPKCTLDASCLSEGQTCESAILLREGFVTHGATTGRSSNYSTNENTCMVKGNQSAFGEGIPDVVYAFTPKATGTYLITVDGDFNAAVTLTTDCNFGSGAVCYASSRGSRSEGERMVVDLEKDVTYFLIVDGAGNNNTSDTGVFDIHARFASSMDAEIRCDDGYDDNDNGLIDCEDPDCAFNLRSCTEAGHCNDGIDNDNNGFTDCDDAACKNTRVCNEFLNGPEACSDGLDNDGNGLTDCDDPVCRQDLEACPAPPGDNCAAPKTLSLGTIERYNTCNYDFDFRIIGSGSGCLSNTENEDMLFKFTAPETGNYDFRLESESGGAWLTLNLLLQEACPVSPINACLDSVEAMSGPSNAETLNVGLSSGDTLWVIVGANFTWTSSDKTECGLFNLKATKR